jgi:hypothetical protein
LNNFEPGHGVSGRPSFGGPQRPVSIPPYLGGQRWTGTHKFTFPTPTPTPSPA